MTLWVRYLALTLLFAGCEVRRASRNPSTVPTEVNVSPVRAPTLARLRVFQEAHSVPGETSLAPTGGEMFISVAPSSPDLATAAVAGQFFTHGLEFALPPGAYEVRTWFRAYTGTLTESGLGLDPAVAKCVTKVDLRAGKTLSIKRVLHGWTRCEFVDELGSWDLQVSRAADGAPPRGGWFIRVREARATTPSLEYEFPPQVVATFLQLEKRNKLRDGDLHVEFGPTETDASLHGCTLKTSGCAHLPPRGACEATVLSATRDTKGARLLHTFAEHGGQITCHATAAVAINWAERLRGRA